MKYIKLTEDAMMAISNYYEKSSHYLYQDKFWIDFAKDYPQHIITDLPQPTDTKERDELLRIAERFKVAALIGNLTRSAQDCVDIAVDMRNAVNAACEKKEDNK